jgi:dTDP-glucose 4,6-dehydratase
MTRVLLTGAGGFVGAHVQRHLLTETSYDIVCPVTFRHRGNSDRIASAIQDRPDWHRRVDVVMCDLAAPVSATVLERFAGCEVIYNVASESHVDRSIAEPGAFIANNVALITNVLDVARAIKPRMVLQMSTDEVYGPAPDGYLHREWDVIAPSNPYSASKAAQEAVCFAYWRTYSVPLIITNTMNIIGEMQDPEKIVPKIMRTGLRGETMPVHAAPNGKPGSRFYLHARNLADAWLFLERTVTPAAYADGATRPDRFHIVGEREIDNLQLVDMVSRMMDRHVCTELVSFHSSRPGHDLRYALDGSKLAALGWKPPVPLEESLRRTVEWTLAHPEWLL